MSRHGWRDSPETFQLAALVFVLGAAFPRLAYRLRWPTRLGPRGTVVYIMLKALEGFWVRQWLLPMIKRAMEEYQQLEEQLGREPTADEFEAHQRALQRERRAARRASVRWPTRPRAARRATRSRGG